MEHLTREELLRVLSEARKHRERDFVWILLGYWHGLRATELISLTAANFADGFLTVQRLKGSKKTKQQLHEDDEPLLNELDAVESWIRQTAQGARLFPIQRKQLWKLMQLY